MVKTGTLHMETPTLERECLDDRFLAEVTLGSFLDYEPVAVGQENSQRIQEEKSYEQRIEQRATS